jgi:hypothetical protein
MPKFTTQVLHSLAESISQNNYKVTLWLFPKKPKNISNRLYIWCVADNFIVNYDFLVIIML